MSHNNNWSNPSQTNAKEVANMASALEERGRALDQQQVNAALMEAVDPTSGECVFEAGCGSGLLCRQIVPALVPGGRVIALDISHKMTSIAQNIAAREGLANRIEWCAGIAETVPFPDGCFDKILAARLLLHVSDPAAILKEMRRVLRPGGKLVTMDWDFETVVVDQSNRELTRRLLQWRCDHYGGNNWSGRQLWRRLADAGFTGLKMVPVVSIATREQDSLTLSLFRAAQVARNGGGITSEEHDAWVAELKSALADGSYFASIVYFIVSGQR
jgi:arsenite methyltransferase